VPQHHEQIGYKPMGAYSTIIPVRAEDPYLCEAIDSVLAQSLPPKVVMVIVNGSDPAESQSAQNVRQYEGRVQLLTTAEIGLVPAINRGISKAETEFISFLDSDDVWLADKQSRQIQLLQDQPLLDAATSKAMNFKDDIDGTRLEQLTAETIMFTATTFRASTFVKFGALDPGSTHFNWLYRWWSSARERGIQTASTGTVETLRRIHDENSWVADNKKGKDILLTELRSIVQQRRARRTQEE